MTQDTSWFVIVNPRAGRGTDLVSRTEATLRQQELEAEVRSSDSAEDVAALVSEAVAAGRDHFVAVGGDGTVNLVVDALMRHEWTDPPTLGILPAGTGCDFVRVFGIPQELESAASHLTGDSMYVCDVGALEGDWGIRYFLNVAQAGIGAASVPASERLARLGKRRYEAAFWLTLPKFKRTTAHLEVGERTFNGQAIAIIFANGQFFGGGMNIAPQAIFTSGEADIQVISARKRSAPLLMAKAKRGLHLRHKEVHRFRGAEWTLTTADSWPVEVDGELLGTTPLSGRILPGALSFKI